MTKGTPVDPCTLDDSMMMGLMFCTLAVTQDGRYQSIDHVGNMGSSSISENMQKPRKGRNMIDGLFRELSG
jgi:hypothetical protein